MAHLTLEEMIAAARPLERAVEQLIVQPLVDAIFAGQVAPGEIHATAQAGKLVFTSRAEE
jgi:ATP-dependent Clp protease ATP-binding subunit ClpA